MPPGDFRDSAPRQISVKLFALVTVLAVALAAPLTASGQTGKVKTVLKDCRAHVKWDSDSQPPPEGRLGFVTGQDRLLAVFRTLESGKSDSEVLLLDFLWPGFILKKQEVRTIDTDGSPVPPAQGALFVWSDRPGGLFHVNGSPAGHAPARVFLEPGCHEILLDLPEGGKAGGRIQVRAGEEEFLCLHSRSWPAPEGGGIPFFLHLNPVSKNEEEDRPGPLRWLEDREGNRVYFSESGVKDPVLRKRVNPHYSETARRAHRQGKVILDGFIGADGRIRSLDVIYSPAGDFSQAAKEAVSQWNYEPATLEGKPVNVFLTIMVEFYLPM